ncbi:neprilysin-4-like isoform X1 [Vespa crabro]|uniref:neprilysin-4-like isoform X1 n=1 Tax=Vespa crabro TaxID=7445 RepID=UPI001F0279E0|nr:neprilysin-4-like isoform X1 [Vespa crabro]XP_046832683.1 neprilysin-4-like isoform X1 [Vespa crabro]
MRGNNTSQYNDDDFFSDGGPCPPCRLAINEETGRLKWCTEGDDTWRFRVRLMLLIPAVLLPITIIFIALSRSQITDKLPHRRTFSAIRNSQEQTKNNFVENYNTLLRSSESKEIQHSVDGNEDEDEIRISEVQTSYVPPNVHFLIQSSKRRKRHTDAETTVEKRNDYNGIKSIDEIREKILSKEKVVIASGVSQKTTTGTSNDETDYFLLDYNPELEFDEPYAYSDIQDYEDYSKEEKTEHMVTEEKEQLDFGSLNQRYRNVKDKTNERSQDRLIDHTERISTYSVSIGNAYGRWPVPDHQDKDAPADFHAFWKDEGNAKSIREAQARIMLEYMDKTANPCQDFYQYACGNWEKRNPIPKDKAAYDTFEMLRESLDIVLKELLEDKVPHNVRLNTDDATVKAKYHFQSCMNYEILEQRMEQPVLKLLEELGGWPILKSDWDPDKFDWLLLVAQLRLYNNNILISEWVGPDIKNSDQYVIQFDQTSLGLPTRDYFLQPSNMIYLNAYKDYFIKIVTLLGASLQNATVHANQLIEFETKLAKITFSPDERRNISELYQKMSIGELCSMVPQIDWRKYLSIVLARPVNTSEPVVVFALQYIQDLVNLLSKTEPRTIANYLLWRFVRHRVNNLDDRFQEAKQKFYYILFGIEQAPPRWKNCVSQVNANMGIAVGSMFVRKYFDEKSKNDTLSMTREIQESFRALLNQTTWIDNETKRLASEKVNAMLLRIGYPDFILQPHLLNERYKDVVIHPDKYFENTLNILQHLTRVEQDRLGSSVNKTLWNTAPAVVNAYYSRYKNQIMFPAGILQPPFYHRYFPKSLNYGGIGVVIGHEITHGFDDKGRLFDKNGNLHRWWKNEDINGFHERAKCLIGKKFIDQYSRYTVSEVGAQINGINTQGENIADNGGIKQAFKAYERWLYINGDKDETLPGISATGRQLFFLNFAQVWCGSMRPEAAKNKLRIAVHAPGKFRVIGTLSNSKAFADVFHCPLGTPMNPINKCSVW